MKITLGFILAFGIGVVCRLSGIPVPAPPALMGAVLVLAMTGGYLLVDRYAGQTSARSRSHGGAQAERRSVREPRA